MAQVDFTNAKIDFGDTPPMDAYFCLKSGDYHDVSYPCDTNGNLIGSNGVIQIVRDYHSLTTTTPGTFNSSGTEFYICKKNSTEKYWRIYNISFNSGDTYEFEINLDLLYE